MSERLPSVIVVSAPSGAGKSTVVTRVLDEMPGLRFSVSHTTRPPRPGEHGGVEYHFVDRPAFERLREEGKLLEWAEVHGNLYGTGLAEYDQARAEGADLLLDVDVQGAAQVREKMPEAVTVFVLPPSYEVLERRLRGRGQDDEPTIKRRLAAAGREIRAFEHYDYAIVNDDLDASVESLKCIVRAAPLPREPRGRAGPRHRENLRVGKGDEQSMKQVYLPRDVDSKFRFITVAAQRAKQLQSGAKPRVDTRSRKATRVAIEETIAGTVSWEVRDEGPEVEVEAVAAVAAENEV